MKCKNCNADLLDGARFCASCGACQDTCEQNVIDNEVHNADSVINGGAPYQANFTSNNNTVPNTAPQMPVMPPKEPIYKKWWLWAGICVMIFALLVAVLFVGRDKKDTVNDKIEESVSSTTVDSETQTQDNTKNNQNNSFYYNESNYSTTVPVPSGVMRIGFGEKVNNNGVIEFTINDAGWADWVSPSADSEYESYYFADISGEKYLVLQGVIKNVSGSDINSSNIYMKAVFNDTYSYETDCEVYVENSDGSDFMMYETLSPLTERIFYLIDPSKETYIYSVSSDSSSSDTTTSSFNIVFSSPDSDYANKAFVNNTNACVVNKVTRTDGGKIDKVGIILYDYNDKQLAKKEESTSSTKIPFHLWYNINSSLGVTLTKGTLYKYKFYAVAGGKTFYSSLNTLVTTGNYTLSFNSNGGSTVSSKQVVCGKTYGSLSTPTKTGYTFKGWYTSASGGSKITSSTVCSSKSNHTLYAQWTPNKLSVYFNSNGGSVSSDTYTVKSNLIYYKSDSSKYTQTWTYNNTKENGLVNASTFGLSRAGYTFAGWGTTSNGGTIFSQSDTSLKPTDINSDITNKSCSTTLYAIWKKITYTLSYNANGGSGAPSAQSGNTSYTVSSTKPTRSGYTFLGWSTSSSATSASYTPGSTISISKNTTLYAVWSKNTYTLSYNANGGSGAPSSQSGNTSYTISNTKPTRSGYTFLGWSTSSSATSATYAPGTSIKISKNTTLYAVWSKNTYTLSYDANGGNGAPSAQSGNTSYTISNTKPTRSGYTFLGWSTSSSATSASYIPGSTISISKNTTLYAVWSKTNINTNTPTLKIQNNPGLKIINYGEKLKLTAIVTDMPSDAEIYWYMNDKKFGEGECVYLEGKGGFAKITAKLVDASGNVITDSDGNDISDSQTVSVNAGFFQKLISFFKNLFGLNRIIVQSFKNSL